MCTIGLLSLLACGCELAPSPHPVVTSEELVRATSGSSLAVEPEVLARFGADTMETVMYPNYVKLFRLKSSSEGSDIVGQVPLPSVQWCMALRGLLGRNSS